MPYKLLLADDSVTIQRVIELTFADEEVQVTPVGNGDQAIVCIESDPPDIVLADIGMPGRGGYEVAAYIKQSPRLAHIPVLLLTGAFEPIDEARVQAVGCDGVLAKPFEPQTVIARVRELLTRPNGPREASGEAAVASRIPARVEQVSSAGQPAGDAPVNATTLEQYFDRLSVAFAELTNKQPDRQPAASPPPEPDAIDWLGLQPRSPRETVPDLALSYEEVPEASVTTAPAMPIASSSPTAARHDASSELSPAIPPPRAAGTPAVPVAAMLSRETPMVAGASATPPVAGQPPPATVAGWPLPPAPAPAVTDDLIDQVTARIMERLSDRVVRETVAELARERTFELVRDLVPDLVREGTANLVRDLVPDLVREHTADLVRETVPEPARDRTSDLVREIVPQLAKDRTSELIRDVLPELARERTSELIRDMVPALARDKTSEVIRETAPALARDQTTDLVREMVPALAKERTSELVGEIAPELASRRTSELVQEMVPDLVRQRTSDLIRETGPDVVREQVDGLVRDIAPALLRDRVSEVIQETAPELIRQKVAESVRTTLQAEFPAIAERLVREEIERIKATIK